MDEARLAQLKVGCILSSHGPYLLGPAKILYFHSDFFLFFFLLLVRAMAVGTVLISLEVVRSPSSVLVCTGFPWYLRDFISCRGLLCGRGGV